ncbi:unnamed protein product [Parnassius mnemosyne]|uniref:Reverse transcriptase domain-containing protein n=1 Tax=Parnassius mnemosyne TaxID=213953 RepID=A0AAV1KVW9_9NEOP
MDPVIITPDDVAEAVRRAPNWKSPGLDGLHHYWLKGFVVCHALLARQFQEALDQKSLPSLFTTGITHLVPKDRDTIDPSKYRPITCLPTIYKTLTSILSARITRHLNSNQVMSRAQNGCRGGGRGTKEPLLIDAVIGKVVKRNRRNLSAAWIDYKKAFDSVPHTWLERVLELYKVDCTVRDFLGQCMGQWSTILCHLGERMTAAENHIRIRRGIFQGDCLSPIWFCLSQNPLSTLLEGSGRGFQLRRGGTKVTHLFYMDDLKLFASSRSHLMELLNITCNFSNSIRMELGTDKCAVLHVERGRVANSEGIDLSMPINITTLSEAETYRYLGMSQNIGVDEAGMKQSVCDVFYARLTKVLNSLLSGVNKTHAYNGWVMPVLMYTFGILRWTQTELNALDRKVRTIMTSHRVHHPRSSVMRLYLPRKHGGRGFLSALTMHNREVCSLRLRAYRRKTGHRLNARLMDLRLKRCRALLKRYAGKKYREILFSDEKIFSVEESYNKQNDKVAKSTQDWLAAREIDIIRREDWPSSSPDLNPLDYKIWQHLEEKACSKPHPNLESLKTSLIKAAADIDMDFVRAAIDDWPCRLKACIQNHGGHFE